MTAKIKTPVKQDVFMYAYCHATPRMTTPFESEIELTNACISGKRLKKHILFWVDGQYCILNLDTGYMISWYNVFGYKAWVNRPEFDRNLFENEITKVLTDLLRIG